MIRRFIFITLLGIFIFTPAFASPKPAYVWNELRDGFYYTTYSFSVGEKERASIHVFRIDPKKFKMEVLRAPDEKTGSTAKELANGSKSLLVVNGGFFTPEHRSIGLIVNKGKQISPLHRTSWWSVFAIRNGVPAILRPNQFKLSKNVEVALQVGPRLVVNGKIPKLKESVATRSAIGITGDGMVTIAITSGQGISMNELARRMARSSFQGGLGCPNAMALDGGSSSQIYAKIGKFVYSQPGLAKITNGLAVFPK